MYIEIKHFTFKSGFGNEFIDKFRKGNPLASMKGFIDFTIMKKIGSGENEDYQIEIRWEDKECFKNWISSDEHKGVEKHNKKEKPDYFISAGATYFESI